MKKLFIILVFSIAFAGIFLSTSCREDENIEAVITVKYLIDDTLVFDTNTVVPYAHVRIEKHDVNVEGTADAKGVFEHTFRDEMILDVRAWELDSNGAETKYGKATIRLKKGEVARKTVFIR